MLTTDDFQDEMEVETEANVYEPFDEFVKQLEMKPLDDTSAEDENEMKVEVGVFTMVSKPVEVTAFPCCRAPPAQRHSDQNRTPHRRKGVHV
jgi:hypothetical protein